MPMPIRRLLVSLALVAVAGPSAAQPQPVYEHTLRIYRASDLATPFATHQLGPSVLCSDVPGAVTTQLDPTWNPTRVRWNDPDLGPSYECDLLLVGQLDALPVSAEPYVATITKARMTADGGAVETCGEPPAACVSVSPPSNRFYRVAAFAAGCPQPPPVAAGPAPVDYVLPATNGGIAPIAVLCFPAARSVFAVGTTVVACTATDSLQRAATCAFSVTLSAAVPPPPPPVGRPVAPSGPSPKDKAVVTSTQPNAFRWTGAATWWNVTFSAADRPPYVVATHLLASRLPVPNLAAKTTYTWQVQACNATGCVDGPKWTITIR